MSKHHNRFCQATAVKNKATNPKTAPAMIAAIVEAEACDAAEGTDAAEGGEALDINREKDRAVGIEIDCGSNKHINRERCIWPHNRDESEKQRIHTI